MCLRKESDVARRDEYRRIDLDLGSEKSLEMIPVGTMSREGRLRWHIDESPYSQVFYIQPRERDAPGSRTYTSPRRAWVHTSDRMR